MTFGSRVKTLRQELGLSQQTFGSGGFVSTPGWIKIENGQRQASEKLIESMLRWLVAGKLLRAGRANALKDELLSLKYAGSHGPFLSGLAAARAKALGLAKMPAAKKAVNSKATKRVKKR